MPLVLADDQLLFDNSLAGDGSTFVLQNALPRVLVIDDPADVWWTSGWSTGPLCGSISPVFTVTYNNTLARVELAGSGFDPFTTVLIERSDNLITWTTVRGAAELELNAGAFTLNDYEFTNGVLNTYRITTLAPTSCGSVVTASVTPVLTSIWIKSLTRPFLNVEITSVCMGTFGSSHPIEMLVPGDDSVTRRARSGVFPIINRTFPIAVNDIRIGREWSMRIRTWTDAALKSIDFLFASGDVLLIQTPTGCAETIASGYITAFDATYARHHRYRRRVVWDIPVQEVAAPGPDIVYAEATWQTVLNQFGSWAAVLAAVPSWAALLALLPNPSEVIVP